MGPTMSWPPMWPCFGSERQVGPLPRARQSGLLAALETLERMMPKVLSTLDRSIQRKARDLASQTSHSKSFYNTIKD